MPARIVGARPLPSTCARRGLSLRTSDARPGRDSCGARRRDGRRARGGDRAGGRSRPFPLDHDVLLQGLTALPRSSLYKQHAIQAANPSLRVAEPVRSPGPPQNESVRASILASSASIAPPWSPSAGAVSPPLEWFLPASATLTSSASNGGSGADVADSTVADDEARGGGGVDEAWELACGGGGGTGGEAAGDGWSE